MGDLKWIYVEGKGVDEFGGVGGEMGGGMGFEGNEEDWVRYIGGEKVYMKGEMMGGRERLRG